MSTLISTYLGKMRETVQMASVRYCKDLSWFELAFCFTFYCLLMVLFPTEPPDDLLRHMKAYTYGYDYRQMWPYSPGVPGFNMYYVFDVFAGSVHQLLGANGFVVIQLLAVLLYAVAIFWLLKGASSRNWRFTLMMILLSMVFFRLFLARPATFESGLFLLAMAACGDERVKPWMHFLLGCLMACFYHLFFIYLIPLVIYRRVYIGSLLCGLAGWLIYGGMNYFNVIWKVVSIQAQRGAIQVAENQTIVYAMLPSLFILLPVLFYWRKDVKKLIATGWFFLSNQMRYMEVIIPSLGSYAKHWDLKLSQVSVAIIVISLCFFRPVTRPDDSWFALKGAVPAGSRVLCLHSDPMFKLVYANDRLKVSPCLDAGWDSDEVKAAILAAVNYGTFNVKVLQRNQYDFVVENTLKEIPKGMELYKVAGKYRIWKVTAATAAVPVRTALKGGKSCRES